MRFIDKEYVKKIAQEPCIVCGKIELNDPHHIVSVAKDGPDIKENLLPMCKFHHMDSYFGIHSKGLNYYVEKNNSVKHWLLSEGWEQDFRGHWFNQKVNEIIKKHSKSCALT